MDLSNGESFSEECTINQCSRKIKSFCKCCKQELCYKHLWEHNDLVIIQLKLLEKDINEIKQKLQTVNVRESISKFRDNLKQWTIDCYTLIDSLCDKKCKEFYDYLDINVKKQRAYIGDLQKQIEGFIESEEVNQQEIVCIKSTVDDLCSKVDKIQESDFPVIVSPLMIDENLIQINY